MTACLFGTYDGPHSANRLLRLALAGAGWDVVECHAPLWEETRDKNAAYFGGGSLLRLGARWARAMRSLVRIYALYEPLKVFWRLGMLFIAGGALIGLRFVLDYFFSGQRGVGHVQSLILAAVLIIVGCQTLLIGLVADLIGGARSLLEDTLFRVRVMELRLGDGPEVVRLSEDLPPPRSEGRASG